MITDINSEDRAVQRTFAEYLETQLGWDSLYGWNQDNFGPDSLLGRSSERDVVLTRDLRAAIEQLNPDLPTSAVDDALRKLTQSNFARTTLHHNQEFYGWIREGAGTTSRQGGEKNSHLKGR